MRETLTLDANLHGGDASDVDDVVRRLGLAACADTLVGGDTGGKEVRGISGGERRRLAIACETLSLRCSRGAASENAVSEKKADTIGGAGKRKAGGGHLSGRADDGLGRARRG